MKEIICELNYHKNWHFDAFKRDNLVDLLLFIQTNQNEWNAIVAGVCVRWQNVDYFRQFGWCTHHHLKNETFVRFFITLNKWNQNEKVKNVYALIKEPSYHRVNKSVSNGIQMCWAHVHNAEHEWNCICHSMTDAV